MLVAGGADCEDGEMFELPELLQAEGANCGEANETSELLQTGEEADEIFESLSIRTGGKGELRGRRARIAAGGNYQVESL